MFVYKDGINEQEKVRQLLLRLSKAPGRPPAPWPLARPMHRQKRRNWRWKGPPQGSVEAKRPGFTGLVGENLDAYGKPGCLAEGNGGDFFGKLSSFQTWKNSTQLSAIFSVACTSFAFILSKISRACAHCRPQVCKSYCTLLFNIACFAALSERVVEIHHGDILLQLNLNKTW